MMGSNNGNSDEKPVRQVTLTQGVWIGVTLGPGFRVALSFDPSSYLPLPTAIAGSHFPALPGRGGWG